MENYSIIIFIMAIMIGLSALADKNKLFAFKPGRITRISRQTVILNNHAELVSASGLVSASVLVSGSGRLVCVFPQHLCFIDHRNPLNKSALLNLKSSHINSLQARLPLRWSG